MSPETPPGGGAGPSNGHDPSKKRHNGDGDGRLNEVDRKKKRDISEDFNSSAKANPNEMNAMGNLYHSHSDVRLPLCVLLDTCFNKQHRLVGPNKCPEPKKAKGRSVE